MDIDTSYLTTLSSQAVSNANASKLRNTLSGISEAGRGATGTEVTSADDEKLKDACRQFESYFVEQMYKQMMATVPEDPLDTGTNSALVDYYKDNLVKEYASQTTEQEGLGLANMLYEQMKRNIGQTPEEIDAKAAQAAAESGAATESISSDES
ncbi:MAG: rod-binding protein [Lachnospiraceae bacterium]|nr:rod-binding protein [Lachnospiraceae bacterium]